MMTFFERHIFFCTNEKPAGQACCERGAGELSATDACRYMKQQLTAAELHGPGKTRVNRAGCLGRCSSGPNIVIYPDNVWYRYQTLLDIDEIIESHVKQGVVVERLKQ